MHIYILRAYIRPFTVQHGFPAADAVEYHCATDTCLCVSYFGNRQENFWLLDFDSWRWRKLSILFPNGLYSAAIALNPVNTCIYCLGAQDGPVYSVLRVYYDLPSLQELCWITLCKTLPNLLTFSDSELIDMRVPTKYRNRITDR